MEKQHEQDTNKKNISGERVRECREEQNLTLEELSELVYKLPENGGKSRSSGHIGYIERGDRELSYEWARLLSKALGVRVEYLLGEDDYKTDNQRRAAKEVVPFQQMMLMREAVSTLLKSIDITVDPPLESGLYVDNPRACKLVEEVLENMGTMHFHSLRSNSTESDEIDELWLNKLNELSDDQKVEYAETIAWSTRKELKTRDKYTLSMHDIKFAVVSAEDMDDFVFEFNDYAMTAVQRLLRDRAKDQ